MSLLFFCLVFAYIFCCVLFVRLNLEFMALCSFFSSFFFSSVFYFFIFCDTFRFGLIFSIFFPVWYICNSTNACLFIPWCIYLLPKFRSLVCLCVGCLYLLLFDGLRCVVFLITNSGVFDVMLCRRGSPSVQRTLSQTAWELSRAHLKRRRQE